MSLQNLRSSYPKLGRIPGDEPRIDRTPFARNDALSVPAPPRGADENARYRAEMHQAAVGRDRAPGVSRADSGGAEDLRARGFQPDRTLRHVDTGFFFPSPQSTGADNTLTAPGNPGRRGRA